MNAVVKRRERIARVRRVQHAQAAAMATAAELHLSSLEHSEGRLTELRASLSSATGTFAAETLASRAELALRLDEARFGLIPTIDGARATAELRAAERMEARRLQESADRLTERAADAANRLAERRASASPRVERKRGG
ncbi:hypothetical protein [Sphingomonas sp.]|uniref:hypothetical protein n=1 Tax=Sphingomonas sp. TaxID=28214 RepID=UPI003AFF70F8